MVKELALCAVDVATRAGVRADFVISMYCHSIHVSVENRDYFKAFAQEDPLFTSED